MRRPLFLASFFCCSLTLGIASALSSIAWSLALGSLARSLQIFLESRLDLDDLELELEIEVFCFSAALEKSRMLSKQMQED